MEQEYVVTNLHIMSFDAMAPQTVQACTRQLLIMPRHKRQRDRKLGIRQWRVQHLDPVGHAEGLQLAQTHDLDVVQRAAESHRPRHGK